MIGYDLSKEDISCLVIGEETDGVIQIKKTFYGDEAELDAEYKEFVQEETQNNKSKKGKRLKSWEKNSFYNFK